MNLATVHAWFSQHPEAAGIGVFLIAMAESLAVVGLIVPGVAMMFVAGALVGTGALSFGPICGYAVAGAIAGDGLSFWLGWRYRERLLSLWPLRQHPEMVDRGIAFFRRFGTWSVLLGRFVGPVRAVIPLVAGMLAMPGRQFAAVNVLSALLWAPAYLLPGMAVGASLDLASQIAGRLAGLLAALLASLWVAGWLSRHAYLFLRPRAHRLILQTFDMSRRHTLLGRLTLPLLDPAQRDYPGLLSWAALLSLTALTISRLLPSDPIPVGLEEALHPLADYFFAVLADLGSPAMLSAFGLLIGLRLLLTGRRLAAAHFLFALAFGLLWAALPARFRLGPLLDGAVIGSAVVFGFTAVLAADRVAYPWRWSAFSGTSLLTVLVAFARVNAGQVELLGAIFSLFLALAWLVLDGVAFRRHRENEAPATGLTWLAPLGLCGLILVSAQQRGMPDAAAERAPPVVMSEAVWLSGGWRGLPVERVQAIGRPQQPLALQWAAPLKRINEFLEADGWREPARAGLLVGALGAESQLGELPVLPHFDRGQVDVLRRVKAQAGGRWVILRLWLSNRILEPGSIPVWAGSIAFLESRDILGLVHFAAERNESAEALALIEDDLRASGAAVNPVREAGRSVLLISYR